MSRGQCYFLETQTEKFLKAARACRAARLSHVEDSKIGSQFDADISISSDDVLDASPRPSPKGRKSLDKRFHAGQQQASRNLDASTSPGSEKGVSTEGYIHCMLPSSCVIDQKEGYLVAAGEKGLGKLLQIRYVDHRRTMQATNKRNLADASSRQIGGGSLQLNKGKTSAEVPCPIEISEVGKFRIVDPATGEPHADNYLLQVELSIELGIFLVAQQKGQVALFSLDNCQRLAFLNEPIRIREIAPADGEDGQDPAASSQQEMKSWTLKISTLRGGLNTHRAPANPNILGVANTIATQRYPQPSTHVDSSTALPNS